MLAHAIAGCRDEVTPVAPTHPQQVWLLSPLISQPSIPPSTEVGVHLIDSMGPLGEDRQGPELDLRPRGDLEGRKMHKLGL